MIIWFLLVHTLSFALPTPSFRLSNSLRLSSAFQSVNTLFFFFFFFLSPNSLSRRAALASSLVHCYKNLTVRRRKQREKHIRTNTHICKYTNTQKLFLGAPKRYPCVIRRAVITACI